MQRCDMRLAILAAQPLPFSPRAKMKYCGVLFTSISAQNFAWKWLEVQSTTHLLVEPNSGLRALDPTLPQAGEKNRGYVAQQLCECRVNCVKLSSFAMQLGKGVCGTHLSMMHCYSRLLT